MIASHVPLACALTRSIKATLLGAILCVLAMPRQVAAEPPAILPIPRSANMGGPGFTLRSGCGLSLGKGAERIGGYFVERLARGTGWNVSAQPTGKIRFEISPVGPSPEAYRLIVNSQGVHLTASGEMGLARGAETLLQMMPPQVYGKSSLSSIDLPGAMIEDEPRWRWRGLHLDVSRHFQDKEAVLRYLDGMASAKLNVFHWHLTDDQGWRLPIAGYPNLTADAKHSYSREDIRDVVDHAAKLGIVILPEIDLPGHSGGLLKAYPELGALNDKGQPAVLNVGDEAAYTFIAKVVDDLVTQFPESPCVHIGADEVGGGPWSKDAKCIALMQAKGIKGTRALQTYFVNRVAGILRAKGRKAIAWNEAFAPDLDKDITIMSWQGVDPGLAALNAGHDVIFSPGYYLYFDHRNARTIDNFPGYGPRTLNLNLPYFFEAGTTLAPPSERGHILGAEACVWGEMIRSEDHMFRMAFPRACAVGESQWSPRDRLNWESFLTRLSIQRQRLAALGIPCNESIDTLAVTIGSWKAEDLSAKGGVLEFPVKGLIKYPGTQEFVIGYGLGEGRFQVAEAELLKDGVSIGKDSHTFDTTLVRQCAPFFVIPVTAPGDYVLRLKVKQLSGNCSGLVQIIPFVEPSRYKTINGAPEPSANESKK